MSTAPNLGEIFDRAVDEGERRLDQSLLELVSTSFIAGFTIVFGIVGQVIVHASFAPEFGSVARVFGALAFGVGMVFLIVGRAELFNENFFDPAAVVTDRSVGDVLPSILRLWALTFLFNLLGGVILVAVLSVPGVLPHGTGEALRTTAQEVAHRSPVARFASGIAGGTLVSLLSFLLVAVDSVGSRAGMAYVVGFLLALGPFDHVIVTLLHLSFGVLAGAPIGLASLAGVALFVTAGNLVGGIGLVATTHVAQAVGANESRQ
ncbi:formate/nitrite transporter family protein [Natronomonas salina]|uniref:formate/nitrite transporter family protein n=1 Tax=Natronomonas salina TaxID=1710540 RepID=UPI0015B3CC29|nr:formate/nitrite transporter family protein [Natronomonas salina]QLD90286.1 formate/nitrite transporter family protein [Natronomonas salina]